MKVDLYPETCVVAIRVLVATLRNPNFILAKDERLHLEQFVVDLQDELDNEIERQWLSHSNPEG